MPRECPQEAGDLYLRCLSREAADRPSAIDIVNFISSLPKSSGKAAAAARQPSPAPVADKPGPLEEKPS